MRYGNHPFYQTANQRHREAWDDEIAALVDSTATERVEGVRVLADGTVETYTLEG